MVHKKTRQTDPMDAELRRMDRQQDAYIREAEKGMERDRREFEKTAKEAEALALGTYATVRGLGESAKKGVESAKAGAKVVGLKLHECQLGANELICKLKGGAKGVRNLKWYQREPVRVYVAPEILKKREAQEKKYLRIEMPEES